MASAGTVAVSFSSRAMSERRARWNSRRFRALAWTSDETRRDAGAVCGDGKGPEEGRLVGLWRNDGAKDWVGCQGVVTGGRTGGRDMSS